MIWLTVAARNHWRQIRTSSKHVDRRVCDYWSSHVRLEPLEPRLMLDGTFLDGQSVGDVSRVPINEASGLAASQLNADVLWTHNDSGDSNRIFAIGTQGQFLGSFKLSGAGAIDWEDLAIGPGPQPGASYVYVGDIGNNSAHTGGPRATIAVYRVFEPLVDVAGGDQSTTLTGVDTLTLDYPNNEAHDAETLLVDPLSGDLYIVTKRDTKNRIYRAAAPGTGDQALTLEFMGETSWGTGVFGSGGAVGGDVSPTGLEILLKSYTNVYVYDRIFGTELWEALVEPAPFINSPYTSEPQGEAIAFDAEGVDYYTLSESSGSPSQPLLFYDRQSGGPGVIQGLIFNDLDGDGVYEPLANEAPLQGWTVLLDADGDGELGVGEGFDITNAAGEYSIGVAPGTHVVAELVQPGWQRTFPPGDGTPSVPINAGQVVANVDFGNQVTSTTLPHFDDFDDGVADGFDPQAGNWFVNGALKYRPVPVIGSDDISVLDLANPLPSDFQVDVLLQGKDAGVKKNAVIIFDYQGPNDFKFAGGFFGADKWKIGHFDGVNWLTDAAFGETINTNVDYAARMVIEGNVATLIAGGVEKTSFDFGAPLNDGQVGLGTHDAAAVFDDFNVSRLPGGVSASSTMLALAYESMVVVLASAVTREASVIKPAPLLSWPNDQEARVAWTFDTPGQGPRV